MSSYNLTHLKELESEAIFILREVAAQFEKPVMLFSGGKDSIIMFHLARKAFHPGKVPFPLMHVDTGHNFPETIEFRDQLMEETGEKLIVKYVQDSIDNGTAVEETGVNASRNGLQTVTLLEGLEEGKYDCAMGGARRDEEKSRAKERVFSFRNSAHRWDPKTQRPELWNLYNGRKSPGESIRIFPLSNWTELDIWQYIYKEQMPIVPLYFAAERPVIERDGMLMLVDDDRLKLFPGEKIETRRVRFRTLGCYPLTGAVESEADDLPKILLELLEARTSERQGRAIDKDSSGSMEKKKQEGYF